MNELLAVLRAIPRPVRWLAGFFLFVPLAFVLARALRMPTKWALLFVLGLLVIFVVLAAFNAMLKARERRRARSFESNLGMHSKQAGVGKEEIREALAELADKWQQAVGQLRASGMSIYDLPWYLLIGEPQSGKSTTLQNSGLEFPVGADGLSGAGGTRNCDWWFSNEAVILDTAGRFTFQEESAPDQHEWGAFLRLLAKHRKACPINGVIVVIPATSLVEDAQDELERKAKNIRNKLLHLQKELGIRFPVFVLVTKADRILGFSEFFSRLDPADQRQLFGWSNPAEFDKPWDPRTFPQVFSDLVARVHKVRMRLLSEDLDLPQVDKLFVFPEELAALQEPLATYFHTIFAGSRYEEPFIFRGFYVTSGIQQGRPIARACRDLLRVQVGDPQGVLENLESVFRKSRAFFIRDFYEKKVFAERGLIARTRLAAKRDRVNRALLIGLGAVVIPLLLLMLGLAFANLYTRLSPINATVQAARECADASAPCPVARTWELIERLEAHKRALRASPWTMRLMLRSGARNEVTSELLPAMQAELFRVGVMPHLMASLEARATRLDWGEHHDDYEPFLGAFSALLRVREHKASADPSAQRELREALSIEPAVTFCKRTKDLDPSNRGREVDEWVQASLNAAEVDTMFREMVAARPELASAPAPEPVDLTRRFREYWTVENLARWDPMLYFKRYTDLLAEIARYDALSYATAEDAAVAYSVLGTRFAKNWEDGERVMKGEGPAAGARRPGRSVGEWVENCAIDFRAVTAIARSLTGAGVVEGQCRAIPDEWTRVIGRREDFRALYAETRDDRGAHLSWSEDARKLEQPLVELGGQARPEEIRAAVTKFQSTLSGLGSASERLDEILGYYKAQEKLCFTPVDALESFAASAPDGLPVVRVAIKAREAAAAVVAARVLPPVTEHFARQALAGCGDCYTRFYAQAHVPAASKFIIWARRVTAPIRGHQHVARMVSEVSSAEYDYLREALRRSGGGGGGGGSAFDVPGRALQAPAWSEFVREIRSWRPVVERGGGASYAPGGGISPEDLQAFIAENDDLRPLLREAGFSRRPSREASGPNQELVQAATTFQRCVAVLDDRALPAWKQLAGKKDGASLADLHAFSGNNRLRGDRDAERMRDVEAKAAALLVRDIRPEYEERSRELWRRIDRCCSGRFPFLTERELRARRDEYDRGPSGGTKIWSPPVYDRGRREVTAVLNLETVSRSDIDQLFWEDETLDKLFRDFALDPIVSGEERMIDFVGDDKERLAVVRRWQGFLFPEGGERGQKREFTVRLLERPTVAGRVYLGERVGRVDIFGPNTIRPSTDANRGVTRNVEIVMDDRPVSIAGTNEDRNGWTGRLEIRGGPLKMLYFVELASIEKPRQDSRIWTARIELPDFERSDTRPEAAFELAFQHSLPGVLPSLGGD